MIKLTPIVESIPDREFEHDLYDIQSEVEQEWWNGQKHQSWRLVPARDLLYVWNTFVKYGRVDEPKLEKIWEILKECAIKIILNSDWWRGDMAILFGKDSEDELTSDDYERFALFMGDGQSKLWRGTGDAHGMGRYTDQARRLYELLMKGYRAQTPEEKIMAVDQLINFVHGSGNMAKWFVEGGVNTLNRQRDIAVKGIHLTGKLSEVEFRKSKNLTHIMDVPMFSIFVPAVKAVPPKLLQMHFGPKIKTECSKARNEIHRIGFPSMHANIVIRDLSKEPNQNTGEIGIGGRAHHYKKFMEIDHNSFSAEIIVHEWAHLWMMNNSKEFKAAVKIFYSKLMHSAGEKIDTTRDLQKQLSDKEDRMVIDLWSNGIEKMFNYLFMDRAAKAYAIKGKKITPDLFEKLPHLFQFDAKLKRPIVASSLYNRTETFPVGTKVYVVKGNSGWLIGKDIENSRYEILTKNYDDLFDYVDSSQSGNLMTDIQVALQKDSLRNRQYNTSKYLEKKLDEELKSGLRRIFEDIAKRFNARITPEEIATVQSWSQYILPKYLEILRSRKLLPYYQTNPNKIYDALWVGNPHKPIDLSFTKFFVPIVNRSKADAYRKDFMDRGSFSGKEFEQHRITMAQLNNWVSTYGMSNEDELWATAIEYFFKLPLNYRKVLVKIMMRV